MSGILITFEGVEGSGKSTQLALLRDALQAEGHRVFTTREPGGHPIAEAIREVLLKESHAITPQTELLLFIAARAQLVEDVLRPQLEVGTIVLCDRYIDSTTVYQGYARGHDLEFVRCLNEFATGGLMPTRTFLLDLPVEEGLARQTEHNRMEQEPIAFHHRVREGYLAEAQRYPERFRTIDARQPIETIHAQILTDVREVLKAIEVRNAGG